MIEEAPMDARSDASPQFDDRRFLHRGNGKATERFEHRQLI